MPDRSVRPSVADRTSQLACHVESAAAQGCDVTKPQPVRGDRRRGGGGARTRSPARESTLCCYARARGTRRPPERRRAVAPGGCAWRKQRDAASAAEGLRLEAVLVETP